MKFRAIKLLQPTRGSWTLHAIITLCTFSSLASAQSGTWSGTTTPLTWDTSGNWASAIIADGSGNTANFTNDIAADSIINVSADKTIGNIVFGDSNAATAGSWTIANNGTATNNLIFAGTTPTITVNALGTGKTATISAIIQGTAGLTKSGSGTLVLSGLNTFTGGFTINEGRVNFSQVNGLGANNITIGGSNDTILDYTGGNASVTGATGWTLTGAGTVTRSNSSGTGIGWGTAKITGSSGGLIYTAGSAGAVIQVGAVTSDYTGGTILTSGTIVMNGANDGDTATAGTFGNGSVASNVVTFNGASIRGGQSTATRTIFNNISFAADTTLAATASGNAGALTWAGEVTLNGTGTVRKLTQASATQDWVFSNTIKNGTVSDLTVDFTSTRSVSLAAANTFTGTMLVTGTGGGGLALAHVNALQNATLDTGTATASRAVTFTAAGTNTYQIGALQGADDLALGANSIRVGTKAVDTSFTGAISGTGGLTKAGSNKLTLTNTHSYSGNTTVQGGELIVNGNISSSTTTTVESGATISGTGTVGALTINSGGFVNPGNSPGTLNTGNYNQAGTLIAEITGLTPGTQHDQINVTGTVTLSGLLDVQASGGTYAVDNMIFLILNDGVDAVSGTFSGLAQGATAATFGGFDWIISYEANSTGSSFLGGNDVALRAIPEPSAILLSGLGVLALLRRRRR